MPKELMTGARVSVAQMGDRMYKVVAGSSRPERALKNEVMRVRGSLPAKELDAVLGRVYVRLGSSERTARVAGYMRDLYGIGTSRRLFVPKASVGARKGQLSTRRANAVARSLRKVLIEGTEIPVVTATGDVVQVKVPSKSEAAKVIASRVAEKKKSGNKTVKNDGPSGGDPSGVVNLQSVARYCLETASHYDEVKPVYDMLMELYYNVPDEEWDDAKRKIKARMRELEQKPRVVVSENSTYIETQQIVGRPAVQSKDRRKNPTRTGKIVSEVYEYVYYKHDEGGRRIAELHKKLRRAKWIDDDTELEKFEKLFSGNPDEFNIKWTGAHADLCALIKCLLRRGLIKCSAGATQWVIARSHFINKSGVAFTNWNRQKENQKTQAVIEKLADILDPAKEL